MIFKIYSAVIVLLFSSSHLCTALSFSPGPLIPFSALSEVHIHCSDGFFRLWIRSLSVTLIYKKKKRKKPTNFSSAQMRSAALRRLWWWKVNPLMTTTMMMIRVVKSPRRYEEQQQEDGGHRMELKSWRSAAFLAAGVCGLWQTDWRRRLLVSSSSSFSFYSAPVSPSSSVLLLLFLLGVSPADEVGGDSPGWRIATASGSRAVKHGMCSNSYPSSWNCELDLPAHFLIFNRISVHD